MTKINEFIDKIVGVGGITRNNVAVILKQYAEMYAMKVLEVAAENANSKFIQDDRDLMSGGYQMIDKDSILNIKLPEHE